MDDSFVIDKRFTTRVTRSQRVIEVAEAFGLGLDDQEFVVFDSLQLQVPQGSIVYITGQSGAGKSVLLRELRDQHAARGKTIADLNAIELDPERTVIDQIGRDTNDAIRILSIAGLNDAYLFLRRPHELSDGQRYRFRMAKAIESGADVWVADEFMAVLDRVAARVISHSVQKAARKMGKTLIVATTHMDLKEDLQPSLMVEKRFQERVKVEVSDVA